jgi:hypothetical protein
MNIVFFEGPPPVLMLFILYSATLIGHKQTMTTNYKPSHSLIVSRVEIKNYIKCGSQCSSVMAYSRETNGARVVLLKLLL